MTKLSQRIRVKFTGNHHEFMASDTELDANPPKRLPAEEMIGGLER